MRRLILLFLTVYPLYTLAEDTPPPHPKTCRTYPNRPHR